MLKRLAALAALLRPVNGGRADAIDVDSPVPGLVIRNNTFDPTVGPQFATGVTGIMDRVDEDGLRHLAQPELNVAVDAARRRKVGDAWAWHRRDTSADISPLVAATLAVEGLKEEPPRRKTGRAMAV